MRLRYAVVLCVFSGGCDPLEDTSLPALARVASVAPSQSVAPAAAPTPQRVIGKKPEAWIHEAPSANSKRLGYVAPGGSVISTGVQKPGPGCRTQWLALDRGHVCGDDVTTDASHLVATLFDKEPQRDRLPYLYVRSRYPSPTRYARFPSEEEQREHEPDLRKHLKAHARRVRRGEVTVPTAEPLPEPLAEGIPVPALEGASRRGVLKLGRAGRRSGFALLGTYEHEGRQYGLTREPALIPLDRTRSVQPSSLAGAVFTSDDELPIAIVTSKRAKRYRLDGGKLRRDGALDRYTVVRLTGERRKKYLEGSEGEWVRSDRVVVIERYRQAPVWATRGDKWIDISILKQTLVAYEGERPVFATLVSTGADGLAFHKNSHATIQGTFLIHTKHVTTRMGSEVKGQRFDLRDVPFVQYFKAGYALHAAYWHDDFGRPRSHGCVNLSPHDAAWLFEWTGPRLPRGWYGALSEEGTLVHIHP